MKIVSALVLILLSGCAGGMSLAPHLSRERDLGPAAAAERYGVVMDRAAAFETQNQKSRDVYWYRIWRAGAMIGLGQVDQGIAVIDQVFADIAATGAAPAQADRLRAFGYDLRARGALVQNRPKDALTDLERSYNLATELPLETRGECDQPMMLAARSKQLEDVARRAGDTGRAAQAHTALARQLERWTKCLAELDYPGMNVIGTLGVALSAENTGVMVAETQPAQPVQVAPEPPKPAQKETAAAAKAKQAEPAKEPAKPAAPEKIQPGAVVAALPTTTAQYAPVDATPWRDAIESSVALVGKHGQGAKGDVVIRTDGGHHALRIKVILPKLDNLEQLVPLFRSTVVFFEQSRNVSPKVERVLIVIEGLGTPIAVLAQKNDVLELFQERLDAASFTKRLVRVM